MYHIHACAAMAFLMMLAPAAAFEQIDPSCVVVIDGKEHADRAEDLTKIINLKKSNTAKKIVIETSNLPDNDIVKMAEVVAKFDPRFVVMHLSSFHGGTNTTENNRIGLFLGRLEADIDSDPSYIIYSRGDLSRGFIARKMQSDLALVSGRIFTIDILAVSLLDEVAKTDFAAGCATWHEPA
jgi:hypothetical protein